MTCAKVHVECKLITASGTVVGSNACHSPQAVCPREPGEGYAKCKTICAQPCHAEIDALLKAEELGYDVRGATAIVSHWNVCKPCARALRDAGVLQTIVREPYRRPS